MKRSLIVKIVFILAIISLYFIYKEYEKYQYVSQAKIYKECVFTATGLAKCMIEKTDEIKTKASFIKKKHETTYYKNKEEATNYGCMVLKRIMDYNWQIDDMKKYSKVILDSCLKEASICLNKMREHKDSYPYDHQSFENALKTLRPMVKQYEDGNFTKDFYNSSMKDISNIYDDLSETDISIGEISNEYQQHIVSMAMDIIRKSNHIPVTEMTYDDI